MLGNIDGSFQAPITYSVGGNPHNASIGDLNGDGFADLVTNPVNGVSVLLGVGDGTFQLQPATYPAFGDSKLGDLNGDGKLDVVVAGNNAISVLLGNGDGTFQSPTTVADGNGPGSVTVGDLNGDGKADLALTDNGGTTIEVRLGNGDGSFQSPTLYTVGQPNAITIFDVNQDGKVDLAVGGSPGISTGAAAFNDMNGDGKLDLVGNTADSILVSLGTGDGSFGAAESFSAGPGIAEIAVRDFNGDRKFDIVASNSGSSTISVLLNTTTPNPNSAPIAKDDIAGVTKGKVVTANAAQGVLANDTDPDNDTLHVTAVNGSSANVGHALAGDFGKLTLNADGSYSYAANKGGSASPVLPQDTFTYTVDDGHGGTSTATLTVSAIANNGQVYKSGTDGNDTLNAGTVRTVLDGGNGNDVLVLVGGNSADALIGGRDNDTLTGGKDSDTFVFNPNFGKDVITDFKQDYIQIDNTLFADFAAVQAHAVSDGNGNTVITYDTNNTITLTGVAPSQLHANDFFFV